MAFRSQSEELESSGAYRGDTEIVPDDRGHDGAEDLYGVQHFLVRKRRDTHLECDAGDATENFIHIKDLFRDGFSVADQQRAGRSAQGVELSACGGWPAAFLADLTPLRIPPPWIKLTAPGRHCLAPCRITSSHFQLTRQVRYFRLS